MGFTDAQKGELLGANWIQASVTCSPPTAPDSITSPCSLSVCPLPFVLSALEGALSIPIASATSLTGKTQTFTSNAELQTSVTNCLTIINQAECTNFPKHNVELTSMTSGSLAAPSANHGSDVLLTASVPTLLLAMTVCTMGHTSNLHNVYLLLLIIF